MEKKARSYKEIIKDCLENRDNKALFNKFLVELLKNNDVKEKILTIKDNEQPIESVLHDKLKAIKKEHFHALRNIDYLKTCLIKEKNGVIYSSKSKIEQKRIKVNSKINKYRKEHFETSKDLTDSDILEILGVPPVQEMVSLDEQFYDDSNQTLYDKIADKNDYAPEERVEHEEKNNYTKFYFDESQKIKKELFKVFDVIEKITNKSLNRDFAMFIMLCTCLIKPGYKFKNLNDIMNELCTYSSDEEFSDLISKLCSCDSLEELSDEKKEIKRIKIKPGHRKYVDNIVKYCKKHNEVLRDIIKKRILTSTYTAIIEYLITENNAKNKGESNDKKSKRNNVIKKLSMSELITDFNKIRNYLSILLLKDDIKDKSAIVRESALSESSYEKDIPKILHLFHKKDIFKFKDELKKYKPNEFSKIYETHTVPHLVSNLLILDVLNKFKLKEKNDVKLADITETIFQNSDYNEDDINNFRKYNLLSRLKELEEYGFIKIGGKNSDSKDTYSLTAKTLDEKQKKSLEFVVPFFCGLYPFSSIGHFLANRLDSKDIFEFESFNIANILEDCITYDVLDAINNKQSIKIYFKRKNKNNRQKEEKILPEEILIDKKDLLLKVVDNKKQEYYLNKIDKINDKKPNNLIFSEIYSFYYKIFEVILKNPNSNICEVLRKYGSVDSIFNENVVKELQPTLSNLENIEIPLTNLELRWLKTIMQDVRFDLFVSEDDKHSLGNLVEDVIPFDLSAFKIYDDKTKTYKSITTVEIPNGEDRDSLKKKLKEFNSVLYSIQNNTFIFNCKKA